MIAIWWNNGTGDPQMLSPMCKEAELTVAAHLLLQYGDQLMRQEMAGKKPSGGRGEGGQVELGGGHILAMEAKDVAIVVAFDEEEGKALNPRVDFLRGQAPTPGQVLLAGQLLNERVRVSAERAVLVSMTQQPGIEVPRPGSPIHLPDRDRN